MKLNDRAAALARLFNRLLAMTEEAKRDLLDQLGAPVGREWTREEKARLMMTLAEGADTLPGTAGELARTLDNEKQRYLALDILREPTQVVTLDELARTLGAKKRKARDIKAGAGAFYLAFTFADNARRRVDDILARIGQEIAEVNDFPECIKRWTAAAIQPTIWQRRDTMAARVAAH